MDYHHKYLKYKTKYLELKSMNGGSYDLNKEIIWITFANFGYVDFVINFSLYAKPLKFNLVVFCLDEQTYNILKNIYTCIKFYKDASKNLTKFGNTDYKNIVFMKLYVIAHAFDLYPDKLIGYIDTDIILFQNPEKYIRALLNKYPDVQIFTQCDEGGKFKECSNRNYCPNMCSGVMLIKNSDIMKKALKYTSADINNFETDQHYLNSKLDELKIKRFTFSRFLMPNGAFYRLYKVIKHDLPKPNFKKEILIHFNYLIGTDKIKVMKKWGFWNQKVIDELKAIF